MLFNFFLISSYWENLFIIMVNSNIISFIMEYKPLDFEEKWLNKWKKGKKPFKIC